MIPIPKTSAADSAAAGRRRSDRILMAATLAGLGAALFLLLFVRGFSDPDEGRYAEIPREMAVSGRWMEMRMLGYRYYEKPPLSYWVVAPFVQGFGARDWAARIPLLLNGLAITWLCGWLARRAWRVSANIPVFVMATTVGFVAGTALLLTDAFLMFWFVLTGVCLFLGFQPDCPPTRRRRYLAGAVLGAALGFLTKGAVAVVLPAAIAVVWLLWERRWRALLTWEVPAAAGLLAAALAAALLRIEEDNPGFFFHFVFEEHLARFLGTRTQQLHPEPFWFFLPIVPLLMLPWTLFLGRAIDRMRAAGAWCGDPLSRFLLVWVAVVVVFFSIGTGKLMSYVLPAIPPLGLLLGRWGLAPEPDGRPADRRWWALGMAAFPLVTLAILGVWLAAYFRWVPDVIYAVDGRSAAALLPALLAGGAVLVSGAWRRLSGLACWHAGILLTCALLLSPLAGPDFNVLLHINSSHAFQSLAAILKPEDQIVVFWSYRPALPFYTQRLYRPFQEQNELSYGMALEPERPADLDTPDALRALVRQASGRVFAVLEPRDLPEKFAALGLPTADPRLPRDPDTIILELLPETPL